MKTVNDFSKLVDVVNSGMCCGCGTCGAVCSAKAIVFKENIRGFRLPEFVPEKCVSCGKCEKACPKVEIHYRNNETLVTTFSPSVFTGFSRDASLRKNGSSGGLLTQLLLDGLLTGRFDAVVICRSGGPDEFGPVLTNDPEIIVQAQGSKYVQIPMNLIISQILKSDFIKICFEQIT